MRIFQITAVLAAPLLVWAYANGPQPGCTTAPGDKPGVACVACHNSYTLNSQGGTVSIAFPNGPTYSPGAAQTFTVTVTDPDAVAYGFQMTARADTSPLGQQAGTFAAGTNQKVICAGPNLTPSDCSASSIQWIEHSEPLLTNTFTVQWTAPASNIGNVHIYIAANAAVDGPVNLDHIYSADYVLTPPAQPGAAPVINPSGIVNAASYASTIQSGSFVTIFGSNFSTTPVTWDQFISDNVFPTTLGGISVSIDGRPAPVYFAGPTQINVLAPADATAGLVNVVVSSPYGSSAPAQAQLAQESPGFFTFAVQQNRYIAAQIAIAGNPVTYEYLLPAGSLGSTPSRPAKPAEIVVLYGTGFGPTKTTVDPEDVFTGAAATVKPVTVTIGGQPATVQFAGLSGAGLYQLNVVVPEVGDGDQLVVATTTDGVATTQQVYIPVQR